MVRTITKIEIYENASGESLLETCVDSDECTVEQILADTFAEVPDGAYTFVKTTFVEKK